MQRPGKLSVAEAAMEDEEAAAGEEVVAAKSVQFSYTPRYDKILRLDAPPVPDYEVQKHAHELKKEWVSGVTKYLTVRMEDKKKGESGVQSMIDIDLTTGSPTQSALVDARFGVLHKLDVECADMVKAPLQAAPWTKAMPMSGEKTIAMLKCVALTGMDGQSKEQLVGRQGALLLTQLPSGNKRLSVVLLTERAALQMDEQAWRTTKGSASVEQTLKHSDLTEHSLDGFQTAISDVRWSHSLRLL